MILNSSACPDLKLSILDKVYLESQHYEQALQISHTVVSEQHQWPAYLNSLALFGFEQWFNANSHGPTLDTSQCSLLKPHYANEINAVTLLKIGGFQLCLISIENFFNDRVLTPQAVIDLSDFAAHFYGLVEVQEELGYLIIRGILRRDRLDAYLDSDKLIPQSNWTYSLPISLFDAEPNHFLLSLQHLPPSAIPLPESQHISAEIASFPKERLDQILAELRYPTHQLYASLTWEEGARLLCSPDWVESIYHWRSQGTPAAFTRVQELLMRFTHTALNTALWLDGQIDSAASSLGLFAPPRIATEGGLRSQDKFRGAIATLRKNGMVIPPDVNCAYQDIDLETIPLQLCTAVWSEDNSPRSQSIDTIGEFDDVQQWSLLLILGTQTDQMLPEGIRLRVSNAHNLLHDVSADPDDPLMFAHVKSQYCETNIVSVVAPNHETYVLAPFTFSL